MVLRLISYAVCEPKGKTQPHRDAVGALRASIVQMADIARIEALMRDLEDYTSDTPEFLMRDHLEAMRLYVLNSMPEEYNLTLKLARDLVPAIQDGRLKEGLTEVLESPVAAF